MAQYDIHYGAKYDKTLSMTQITAILRAQVKAAVKSGELPAGFKATITKDHHKSLTFKVTALPATWPLLSAEWLAHGDDYNYRGPSGTARYSAETLALVTKLEGWLQAYNFDGSDTQSDYWNVNFYGHVGIGGDLEEALKAAQLAALAPSVQTPVALAHFETEPMGKVLQFAAPAKSDAPVATEDWAQF